MSCVRGPALSSSPLRRSGVEDDPQIHTATPCLDRGVHQHRIGKDDMFTRSVFFEDVIASRIGCGESSGGTISERDITCYTPRFLCAARWAKLFHWRARFFLRQALRVRIFYLVATRSVEGDPVWIICRFWC
jgi:hypothetical protein